ncbi:aromatic ring-hydroxylating dioxygenase subunit alpha [Sphingobium sp. DC-2]|uniref:aromatic ring-hydroxylating dioxygenase subunit alpha n=1 Tax=Sphingobium sp. DC-2 TaxID=1303256 RepID=UPI0004C34175|nr:aromatic ring-hydroxylating dioxygenase subunit alpha [Sphingobium sp. DC-2]
MTFLRNIWYVACWDHEIAEGALLGRRLLDEAVVLYRDAAGKPVALRDLCPHRLAPLSFGRIVDGSLRCGYHGLGFDAQGQCVHNPFGPPSRTMKVQSYPVVERHSAIWIWMGDSQAADPALIPDFGFNDPDAFFVGKGYIGVKAGYELEIENILDLSHIEFLHPDTLGSDQVSQGEYACQVEGDVVWSNRTVHGEIMNERLSARMGVEPGQPADRWIHVRWTMPANMAIFAGAVPSGRPQKEGRETPTAHLFTPESAGSTHYFYSISFPRAMGEYGAQLAREQVEFLSVPFATEDLPMLQAQQANLGSGGLRDARIGWLPGDAAGARARKILYERIDAERRLASPIEAAAEAPAA